MNPKRLGTSLGEVILFTAREEGNGIHELVQQDRRSTELNFLALLSWTAETKVQAFLRANDARLTCAAMRATVLDGCAGDRSAINGVFDDRTRGYESATADGVDGEGIQNACKYFLACCGSKRTSIAYDEIIPDPADLAEIEDLLEDPSEVKRMRARERKGSPTYPLDIKKTVGVGGYVGGFATAVERLIRDQTS